MQDEDGDVPMLDANSLAPRQETRMVDVNKSQPLEQSNSEFRHNVYHSSETASQFVRRCSPSTTQTTDGWVWAFDPSTQTDHGPLAKSSDFQSAASGHLMQFKIFLSSAEGHHTKLRADKVVSLERQIDHLANIHGIKTGKWMLFPTVTNTDNVWELVVNHIINGRLGVSAKASAYNPRKNFSTRLICVYTRDFSDGADVRRVLDELSRMDLIPFGGIKYKTDAYTLLGLNSGNEFGLRQYRYSSRDFLNHK